MELSFFYISFPSFYELFLATAVAVTEFAAGAWLPEIAPQTATNVPNTPSFESVFFLKLCTE